MLLIGSSALANFLATPLEGRSVVVERAPCNDAAATGHALGPQLIVFAGDAVPDRGAAAIEPLLQPTRKPLIPVLVICTPELGAITGEPAPHHVGYLFHKAAASECARRVHAVLELLIEVGLSDCSLQQLVDTVVPRPKSNASTTRLPAVEAPKQPKPSAHAPASIRSAIASANQAATSSQTTELRSTSTC